MTTVSAPGNFILFGEHAVAFGEPAVALAVDMRTTCIARISEKFSVNDEDLDPNKHPLVRGALLHGWTDMDTPIAFAIESAIPAGTGMGIFAARSVSCLGAISMLHDHLILEEVARKAFEVDNETGGMTSPLATTTSTHGSGILMMDRPAHDHLWKIEKGGITWHAHHLDVPDMQFVMGYTGIPFQRNQMRMKVKRFYEGNAFARDIVKDIGRVSLEGADALRKGDMERVGGLMTKNNKLLITLGINHPMLEKLNAAAGRHSFGTKITGYGGGGCIVALTDTPDKVAEAIEGAGGQAYSVGLSKEGIRLDDEFPEPATVTE